ncbi:MAG: nicotinamide riboside transporter PnuC [Ilumatobacteraceae bacterium]
MDFFNETVFRLFGQDITWTEIIGDISGLLCVWMLTRQIIWNWPVGLVNNVFFFILFADAHLFANSVLQIAYFALGVYGWQQWARHRDVDTSTSVATELAVRRTTRAEWIAIGTALAIGWPLMWWFLERYTDPAQPIWDSVTVALSLIATWAQTRKLLESWWIYIVVDVISVPLFFSQGLGLTGIVYFVFGILCVIGLRDWRRSMTAGGVPAAPTASTAFTASTASGVGS